MADKLDEDHIYECLKSLGVSIAKNDVRNPTKEFMVKVTVCFLKDIGIDVTSKELMPWEATSHFEESEIYEEIQLPILSAHALGCLLSGVSITLKDIVDPKPKKTKKILNYILVFWNYYLKKIQRFGEIDKSYDTTRQRIAELKLENISLADKCCEIKATLEDMTPRETLSASLVEKEAIFNIVLEKKRQLETEYQVLKEKNAEVENSVTQTDLEIVDAKQKLMELDQLIVSSPEKRNSEVQNLKSKIKAEDAKIKDVESLIKILEEKVQSVEEVHKSVRKCSSAIKDFPKEIENLDTAVNETILAVHKHKEVEDEVKKLTKELKTKQDVKHFFDQKCDNIDFKFKKQKDNLMGVIQCYQSEITKEEKAIENIDLLCKKIREKALFERDAIENARNKYETARNEAIEGTKKHSSVINSTISNFEKKRDDIVNAVKANFQ